MAVEFTLFEGKEEVDRATSMSLSTAEEGTMIGLGCTYTTGQQRRITLVVQHHLQVEVRVRFSVICYSRTDSGPRQVYEHA